MPPAICIENVSKRYRLGEVGTGTLSHDLNRAWARLRGKPDPFSTIGIENKREESGGDFVWALKDLNLVIDQGEVLGIIGRNGAGKSTLLKLLSRVTAPTTGKIRARGRIASLLEVGTGFHPELTGRENIYLNGAILGMRRREVKRRLDEIVEFSGCAKYLDTPVKRFSSGMLVRLGFAVAAHLECEILIVDEVLAVGDAEFQKRCISKMQDVSKEGERTVLFVSHNMASISNLCNRAVLLEVGQIIANGETSDVVSQYLSRNTSNVSSQEIGDSRGRLLDFWAEGCDGTRQTDFAIDEPVKISMKYAVLDEEHLPYPNFHFFDKKGECAFVTSNRTYDGIHCNPNTFVATCHVPAHLLNDGPYYIGFALTFTEPGLHVSFFARDSLCIRITEPIDSEKVIARRCGYSGPIPGAVRPDLPWTIQIANS